MVNVAGVAHGTSDSMNRKIDLDPYWLSRFSGRNFETIRERRQRALTLFLFGETARRKEEYTVPEMAVLCLVLLPGHGDCADECSNK